MNFLQRRRPGRAPALAATPGLWWRLIVALAAVMMFPAAGEARDNARAPARPARHHVTVTSHGWHTGIILSRGGLERQDGWPELPATFARAEHVEVGWGSEPFYTAARPSVGVVLRTVFTPTPSVLHVVGFSGPPAAALPQSQTVRLSVSAAGWRAMRAEIGATFVRDERGRAVDRGPGLYGRSRFFAARGRRYTLVHNCNPWTAWVLRVGGLPVRHGPSTLTAGGLMAQVRAIAAAQRAEAEAARDLRQNLSARRTSGVPGRLQPVLCEGGRE